MIRTAAGERGSDTDQIVARVPNIASALVLALSSIVLLGWLLHIRAMQSFVPGLVTMKVNTALGLGMSAIALGLLNDRGDRTPQSRVASGLATLVLLLGAATLAQYLFGWNLAIDELVFRDRAEAAQTSTPGRMAAVTAVNFMLIGGSLLSMTAGSRLRPLVSQGLALATGALGLASLLGYVYGAIPATGIGQGLQIAGHTAIAFVLLAAGALARRRDAGWTPTLLSDRAGGVLARRLLPIAFVVPLCLGALRQASVLLGLFQGLSSSANLAVATMIAFAMVIWRTARELNDADAASAAAERARFDLALREAAALQRADAEHEARAVAEQAREVAEAAVREKDNAYALLDLVLESAPIGFALFDVDLRCRRINTALAAMYDLSGSSPLGRPVDDLLPKGFDDVVRHLRKVLTTNETIADLEQLGGRAVAPTRARRSSLTMFPVHSAAGDVLGVGLIVVDITERRRLEEQLLQAQRMEAIGQLAGGVAHDFNNMLTVITSYSALLLTDLVADDPARPDIQEIKDAADRAANLTRQLLAFSRQQVLQPKMVNLNALTSALEKMLRRLLRADIALETRLAADLGSVHADPGQLEQVLMNLIVNARDAMPDGGFIAIETTNIDLDTAYSTLHGGAKAGPYVVLSVSDSGCGMNEETQRHIFEPFFTTKELGKGTGLGLSTVYGIVEQSGGYMWMYSEVGQGTIFKIYLPRVDGAADARVLDGDELALSANGETVLIVEDEAPVRTAARRILERAGYAVLEAANGAEAIERCEAPDVIDLVLTDMVMPGTTGRELATRLRAIRPDVALVYMSGYTEDAILRRNVLQPGSVFVHKPFTPQSLTQRVREALGYHQQVGAGSAP